MKNKNILVYILINSCLLSSCSKINSMTPFDDQQAAVIAHEIAGSPPAKRHQLPVKGKAQQSSNQNNNSG